MSEDETIHDFIHKHGVRLTCKSASANPNMANSGDMDHWRCTLKMGRRSMTITYSMGRGHGGRGPKVEDVLDSLAMEASGYVRDFESWADEYGYDHDSRSAHKTYNAVKKQTASLKKLMGSSYEELLNVERL